tara:strand:- start:16996 stop:18615 length:1620 start_codon:yes stop_codon:yes gene_type:complete
MSFKSIGLTIIGTAIGAYIGAPGLGAALKGAFVGFNIAQSVIQYDSYRMQKDMTSRSVTDAQQSIQVNATSTESSLPIIYGQAKVGLKIIDIRQDPSDADVLAVVGAFALAPDGGNATAEQGIQSVAKIFFDDRLAINLPTIGTNDASNNPYDSGVQSWLGTAGGTFGTNLWCEYMLHDGDDAQTYDYKLNDTFSSSGTADGAWGTQSRGTGIAYAAFWLYYKDDVFVNGIPNITMIVQGNKVADVSNLTAAYRYSTNPADCIFDYMTSKRYGLGIPISKMDAGVSGDSFTLAQTHCNDTVTVPASYTLNDRYTCNGFLDSAANPMENLQKLLTSCQGRIVFEGGKYKLIQRKTTSAETFALNTDNIVGDWSFQRSGIDDTHNSINATFIDDLQNYQPNDLTFPLPTATNTYQAADGGYKNEMNIELAFTDDEYMTHMIAAQTMLETRADMSCTVVAQREALKLSVGDVVNVTHATPAWSNQPMWVEQIKLRQDGLVMLSLKEYDSDTYTIPAAQPRRTVVAHSTPGAYSTDTNPDPQN